MSFKIRTNISEEFQEIEICINAPKRTEELTILENELIQKSNEVLKQIIGIQNNDIFIIDVQDVIMFFSEEKNNFCKTKDGIFRIKEKLYYLEDVLPEKDFIRISNSAIININHVKCFNTSIIGSILVKFKDGSEENVSKRKVSDVMKLLKNRR